MRDQFSRRSFIRQTVSVGAVGIGAAALLSACGKKEGGGGKKKAEAAAGCTDVSGLTAPEKAMRTTTSKYMDVGPDPAKVCDGCQLYIAAKAGAACGGCSVVKGPIAPKGTCNLWAKKA